MAPWAVLPDGRQSDLPWVDINAKTHPTTTTCNRKLELIVVFPQTAWEDSNFLPASTFTRIPAKEYEAEANGLLSFQWIELVFAGRNTNGSDPQMILCSCWTFQHTTSSSCIICPGRFWSLVDIIPGRNSEICFLAFVMIHKTIQFETQYPQTMDSSRNGNASVPPSSVHRYARQAHRWTAQTKITISCRGLHTAWRFPFSSAQNHTATAVARKN